MARTARRRQRRSLCSTRDDAPLRNGLGRAGLLCATLHPYASESMIKRHEFNSDWWGEEVGIISDPEFFRLPEKEQRTSLEKFAWVEFTSPISKLPDHESLTSSGLFHTD